ncbi:helix-turn-helix domain-containing protein [Alicycliphilus denitrificans]|uniref:helix-turn-helix domain-containing protein n=1 Tax=Alicycliphilus denitrificans TaxID=179636 RepID=UPI00384F411D
MTAFSNAFRSEVARMARKEIKGEFGSLRKTVTLQRGEIAALKRDVKLLAAQLKALQKVSPHQADAPAATQAPARSSKRSAEFDGQALLAKRQQLGITQQAMASLLQASTLSVYKWESGKATPRAAQLERIQALLKMGKRAALAALQ